ncbi:NAD(P)/FAD-dependent oxidoreductase [Paenibacillus sp. HB172176]|uniref:NAD(P)/FAD-dependent oxidoreductase n=1 Tax=Paenibacillus sp. HB172176 TaxID=2493690 RepID=UPI00143A2047|nr:NAD(P)/FAD-dependent oxidoreductase [Paenibacillus sp. HB172176]
MDIDIAIVGGGPAGLNAALVLGRARRSVVLFDHNTPRNAVTKRTHGFLTRDGVSPGEIRRLAHQELKRYPSVLKQTDRVSGAKAEGNGFVLGTEKGAQFKVRKLLLATGLRESLPNVPNIGLFYGRSLFSCPYCDGWELRDKPLMVIAEGMNAFILTRLVYQWSPNLILCTNGRTNTVNAEQLRSLREMKVGFTQHRVTRLIGRDGHLKAVEFDNGSKSYRAGGFVSVNWREASTLGSELGCMLNEQGGIWTDELGRTSVRGVYAAGDNARISPAQAVIAAGDGSRAAIGINTDLVQEDGASYSSR